MSKQVKIRRIALANFKGLRNVAVDFGDTATTISGHNGTGFNSRTHMGCDSCCIDVYYTSICQPYFAKLSN